MSTHRRSIALLSLLLATACSSESGTPGTNAEPASGGTAASGSPGGGPGGELTDTAGQDGPGAAGGVQNEGSPGAMTPGGTSNGAGASDGSSGEEPGGMGGNTAQGGDDPGSAGDDPGAGGMNAGDNAEPDVNEPDVPGDDDLEYPDPAGNLEQEDGSKLWLRYPEVAAATRLEQYREAFTEVVATGAGDTMAVVRAELETGLSGLLGAAISNTEAPTAAGAVIVGTPDTSELVGSLVGDRLADLGPSGYLIDRVDNDGAMVTVVGANTEVGALYGAFALLRHLQTHKPVGALSFSSAPVIQHRVLNHWDNLNGSVERGYSGKSLWNWSQLPGTLSPRYTEYARANASVGINGTVLTNVNADAEVLTNQYLDKVAALADVFRPYGIQVYLTARFSAPIEIGNMNTADPNNGSVQAWWASKADDIYQRIPDFGGFLVKANSEGQPGPQEYGASHADGANMLADALGPHGGIVMWRAFVYSDETPTDRIRQAYDEFKPLDGQFRDNALVQVKNGPLDFQPREPFSPLFGAMPDTPLALELQITKEYLGQDTHLAYLGTYYEEVLQADTHGGDGEAAVARVIDGSLHGYATTAISGVANVGSDANWSGSQFNQANWYVFGRMAWDPDLGAAEVADEWIRQTLSNDPVVVDPVTTMMMNSRQALVDYMTPLGLAHIMATGHHYGPGPWVDNAGRDDWNPVYYHKADNQGLGFDRTASGSNAVSQYFSPLREELSSREMISEDLLLFFHHVGWNEEMSSGRTLWEELVHRYSRGVDAVGEMRDAWAGVEGRVDSNRFAEIAEFLQIQHYEARWWRDACLQYFRQFSNMDIPSGYAQPANPLSFYTGLNCPSNEGHPRCPQVYEGDPSPAILE